jgi:hypothetical protein
LEQTNEWTATKITGTKITAMANQGKWQIKEMPH